MPHDLTAHIDRAIRHRQAVKRAHDKQIEDGWRRLTLRLPPESVQRLDALCAASGLTPTGVISQLLRWPDRKPRTR